jgi:hypothetical protein
MINGEFGIMFHLPIKRWGAKLASHGVKETSQYGGCGGSANRKQIDYDGAASWLKNAPKLGKYTPLIKY